MSVLPKLQDALAFQHHRQQLDVIEKVKTFFIFIVPKNAV